MNDNQHDGRDPLRAAFDDYRRAPRDVVPRNVEHRVDDLRKLADGRQAVRLTHYEMTENGVEKHTSWVTVARPLIKQEDDNQ